MLDPMPQTQTDYVQARANMVESQLRPNRIRDERLLGAMASLRREDFVGDALKPIAYCDEDLEVITGRYLLEPMVLGRLLQDAAIQPEDKVLDVAPATGYSTAVLSAMAREVVAVESDAELAKETLRQMKALGCNNVVVTQGPLLSGYTMGAPYDVILINGGIETVPESLTAQLAEGGRLMALVKMSGRAAAVVEARLYQKLNAHVSYRPLFNANPVMLREFAAPTGFVF